MNTMKKILTAIVFSLLNVYANAQTSVGAQPVTTDLMRSNGKILVVVAVIVIIMIGFFGYLIKVDNKLTKLEKEGIK